ncbi:hypothetical protein GMRT_11911 [Giardia muris]|uniref:Uncharacterized protein n=1 Tax=Giardia muris TaxID=5742 RepID=A0A4Z1SRI7_GIAMU|nr:hypothetical protein GMRT_11911 [Giardia muris]|eukprot:TNJ28524.1 hypothetical protein GMRT_11911 [Giardia muris]
MHLCARTGVPCRTPVACKECGAVYEATVARFELLELRTCVIGQHPITSMADFVILRSTPSPVVDNGTTISTLHGMLEHFETLIMKLADENFQLRRESMVATRGSTPTTSNLSSEVRDRIHAATVPMAQARLNGSLSPRYLSEKLQRHLSSLMTMTATAAMGTLAKHLEGLGYTWKLKAVYPWLGDTAQQKGTIGHFSIEVRDVETTLTIGQALCPLSVEVDLTIPPSPIIFLLEPDVTFIGVHPTGICAYGLNGSNSHELLLIPMPETEWISLERLSLTLTRSQIHVNSSVAVESIVLPQNVVGVHAEGRLILTHSTGMLHLYDIVGLGYSLEPICTTDFKPFLPTACQSFSNPRANGFLLSSNTRMALVRIVNRCLAIHVISVDGPVSSLRVEGPECRMYAMTNQGEVPLDSSSETPNI